MAEDPGSGLGRSNFIKLSYLIIRLLSISPNIYSGLLIYSISISSVCTEHHYREQTPDRGPRTSLWYDCVLTRFICPHRYSSARQSGWWWWCVVSNVATSLLCTPVCGSGPQGPIPRYPARGRGGYFLVTVNNTQDIICHGTRGHLCKSVDNNEICVWAHMRPAISVRSLLSNIIHPNMDLISTCLEPPSFQLIKCEESWWWISFI